MGGAMCFAQFAWCETTESVRSRLKTYKQSPTSQRPWDVGAGRSRVRPTRSFQQCGIHRKAHRSKHQCIVQIFWPFRNSCVSHHTRLMNPISTLSEGDAVFWAEAERKTRQRRGLPVAQPKGPRKTACRPVKCPNSDRFLLGVTYTNSGRPNIVSSPHGNHSPQKFDAHRCISSQFCRLMFTSKSSPDCLGMSARASTCG